MAHDLVTELLQYSSLACFMPIWQLCANLLIPNCLRFNLSYSPLAALELYVNGNKAILAKTQTTNDYSRSNFEEYLKVIMTYAGSASLSRDLPHSNYPKIGDLLVLGGYPGHVVIIIDKKTKNGVDYYLFANSWIPAQDIEIVTGTSTGGETIDNYIPIIGKTIIQINGYKFQTPMDIRTWQNQN